jgi:hypothetical protein
MALPMTQSTYKRHVEEVTAYGWSPMPFKTWLAWHLNKPISEITEADEKEHSK